MTGINYYLRSSNSTTATNAPPPSSVTLQYVIIFLSFIVTFVHSYSYQHQHQPQPPAPSASTKPPHIKFGVIADIQYAPIPDGHSYGGQPRYYRHSLVAARHAAEHFQKEEDLVLMVNLGDIIDGKCQDATSYDSTNKDSKLKGNPGHDAMEEVIEALSIYDKGPILHTYGNHELYNMDREHIGKRLNIPFVREKCGDLVGYYHHTVRPTTADDDVDTEGNSNDNYSSTSALRFVILDSYDIAIMERCPTTSIKRKKAADILQAQNHNYPKAENSPEGLKGNSKRFVAFNGAIDVPQLEWLRETLEDARANDEKVIVLSHQPIMPGSSSPVCLIWNYEEVLDIMRDYSKTIVASFCGHAHRGGYRRDDVSGIHFRTFEAMLESQDPVKTYGIVELFEDRLVVRGMGDCESAEYDLDHMS